MSSGPNNFLAPTHNDTMSSPGFTVVTDSFQARPIGHLNEGHAPGHQMTDAWNGDGGGINPYGFPDIPSETGQVPPSPGNCFDQPDLSSGQPHSFNHWPTPSTIHSQGPKMSLSPTPNRATESPSPSVDQPLSPEELPYAELHAAVSKEQRRKQANSIAAQNYRRRRTSKVAKLEKEIKEKSNQNDDLKWKLAAAEREIQVLRELLTGSPREGFRSRYPSKPDVDGS